MMAVQKRSYDVVLYGATGFVGAQTVEYFVRHAKGLRWALAGRNAAKLEAVRARLGAAAEEVGIVVADADDDAALAKLAASTRVVLSTAGPYALYGSKLVAACVAARTHYVDITGETPWVRTLIDAHHEDAAAGGTRIVPGCGFDSVPSDLGAYLVAQALWREHGKPCVEIKASFTLRGGLNGGTFASLINIMESGQQNQFNDLFLLNPPGTAPADTRGSRDCIAPEHDPDFHAWLGPFVMGPINSRVVRRSAALLQSVGDESFADEFCYREFMRLGRGPAALLGGAAYSIGVAAGQTAMQLAPARALAKRFAPKPGQGPSEFAMNHGAFRCELIGRTAAGHTQRGCIAAQGDPGNRATTKFVCEAALALAVDEKRLPGGKTRGGILTPATALGNVLAQRLHAAGMRVEPLADV
jgi:short subunit dehydrogenase-like uncharacterized protein